MVRFCVVWLGPPLAQPRSCFLANFCVLSAVASGPYTGVDFDSSGFALVPVDGGASHTHAPGLILIDWSWYEGTTLLSSGETTELLLPVGEHMVTLRVTDDGGNESAETTIVTVLPQGFPVITSLSPMAGDVAGGTNLTISGFGFNFTEEETVVHFGYNDLTGPSEISVVDANTIVVLSVPSESLGIPVSVTVSTPIGQPSNEATYTYINGVIIDWSRGLLYQMYDMHASHYALPSLVFELHSPFHDCFSLFVDTDPQLWRSALMGSSTWGRETAESLN